MIESTDWHELDNLETLEFINNVRDENFVKLFEGTSYRLYARNLRFFDGYSHYMLANTSCIPYFTLEYISNGEDYYFLDGSEHALELLAERGSLRLTERNILDYLAFFSSVTFYPYRKVKFIINPDDTPYSGASAMNHHFKTIKYHTKLSVEYSDEEEKFFVTLPVLYNGETVKGRIEVHKCGAINVLEPVRIPLMDRARDHVPLDYDHPHEAELLAQNFAILDASAEGKRLRETIYNHGGTLRLVSGVGSSAFTADGQNGFIVAPENLEMASPYQVIAIAGTLRDMELKLMGETRSTKNDDLNEIAESNMAQNLDVLLRICTIVDELADAGHDDVLTVFKKIGFEALYGAYKNEASLEDMSCILATHLSIEVREE